MDGSRDCHTKSEVKYYMMIAYMRNLKRNNTNEPIYRTETDSQTQRTDLRLLGGKVRRRDSQGVWDGHVYTAVFKMDNQQGPTGNTAQSYVAT